MEKLKGCRSVFCDFSIFAHGDLIVYSVEVWRFIQLTNCNLQTRSRHVRSNVTGVVTSSAEVLTYFIVICQHFHNTVCYIGFCLNEDRVKRTCFVDSSVLAIMLATFILLTNILRLVVENNIAVWVSSLNELWKSSFSDNFTSSLMNLLILWTHSIQYF